VSGVWRISEEPFFHVPHLTDFRVRASRGTAGNSPQFVAQYETYNCSATGCSLEQAGNPLLKPETTAQTEIGTDLTLFNRLGVVFTYVDSKTKNQVLPAPTPATYGFSSQWQNAGTLASKTFEAELSLPVVTRRNFSWNMKGTWDKTRTWISELFVPAFFTAAGTAQGTSSFFYFTALDSTACQRMSSRSGCLPTDNRPLNQYGNIWGRAFYKGCGTLPASVQAIAAQARRIRRTMKAGLFGSAQVIPDRRNHEESLAGETSGRAVSVERSAVVGTPDRDAPAEGSSG
jgi:outer membrane receptor protein involved in Fe transport